LAQDFAIRLERRTYSSVPPEREKELAATRSIREPEILSEETMNGGRNPIADCAL